jgi:DNA-binding transcriptional regulator LsrR (DeoR family)
MAGEASTIVALQAAQHAHLALVGVGAIGIGSSEFVLGSMHLSPQERKDFFDQQPVGDVCGRFFDVAGRPVTGVVDSRVLGLSLAELRAIPTVVGIAAGAVKAPGLLGALRAGYLDVVICDSGAARALMAAARNDEPGAIR